MPIYTVENKDGDEWDVNCSYEELQTMLKEKNLRHVYKPPNIASTHGSLLSKTPDGWKDRLKQIKKGSGKGDTIKV
tara:strand:+ start:846 stop:1073 length:228 start_codon:yes stop_codon:yes gene_type:complete